MIPAFLIILSNSNADPSNAGISGELHSIKRLSISLPLIAAKKCSTVKFLLHCYNF